MTSWEVSASGVSNYKVVMQATVSGQTVTVTAKWRRTAYGYSSYSANATWRIVIDGTTYSGTWDFNGPAGGAISLKNIASRSKNVGWNGSTNVQVTVDFDVSPGSGHISKSVTVATTPTAPGKPSLSLNKPDTINANWSNSSPRGDSIDRYQAQTATNAAFTQALRQDTNLPGSAWTIHNAPIGKRVYVRARAHNGKGWGAWSATAYIDVPDRPNKPGTPSVSFDAPTSANMSWAAPGNGGSAIDNYQIQVDDNTAFSSPAQGTTTSRSYHVTGLAIGKTWYFRVRAHNSQGWSPWSGARSLAVPTTPSASKPSLSFSAPTTLQASWAAANGHGRPILEYSVQWADNSGFSGATSRSSGTARSRNITGLTRGTTYYVRVRARTSQGWGSWSAAANHKIPDVPNKPSAPTTTAVNVDDVKVSWNAPGNGGASLDNYQVQVANNPSFNNPLSATTTSRTRTFTGTTVGKTWYARVRAHNSQGWGPWSASSSVFVARPPDAPAAPSLSSPSPTQVSASWNAPNNGGASITGYDVQIANNSSFSGATTVSTTSRSTTFSNLQPGTPYYVRVRAKNSQGASAWSSAPHISTLPASAPGLSVTAAPSGRSATLVMSAPGGISTVNSYRIERRVGSGAATTYTSSSSTYNATGLSPGTTYQWRAAAVIGSYQSPWSGWVTLEQPRPSTDPGDYFDGATPNGADVSYSWTGTANNSASQATGKGVTGWTSYSPMALYRTTGGYVGDYGATVIALSDVTTNQALVAMSPGAPAAVAEGGTYTASVFVQTDGEMSLGLSVFFYDDQHVLIEASPNEYFTLPGGDDWHRISTVATAPAAAVEARISIRSDANSPILSGTSFSLDAAMVTLGGLVTYFDGSTPDSSSYSYAWLGTPNASESQRDPADADETDPLADPDCPAPPIPPPPPTIADDCVTLVGSWRRYWVILSPATITKWVTILPTLTLHTGALPARQVRIRFYPNPDNLDPTEFIPGDPEGEQVISYMPPETTMTLDAVAERVWADVEGRELPADHLLRGIDGGPAEWPTLQCGIGYLVAFDVPLDAPDGNLTIDVALTQRMG